MQMTDMPLNNAKLIEPLKRHEFWNKEGRMYLKSAIAGFILTAIILACDYFIGDKVNYIVIIGLFIINALIFCWYLPRKIAFKACDVRYEPLQDKYLDENNNDLERVYLHLLNNTGNTHHQQNHFIAIGFTFVAIVIMFMCELDWLAILAIPTFFFTFLFIAGMRTQWPISFEYKFHNVDSKRFPIKETMSTTQKRYDPSDLLDPRNMGNPYLPGTAAYHFRVSSEWHDNQRRWHS